MTRSIALLVNPSAAGGRAVKWLPGVRAELERLGAPSRVVETRDIEHAREEAKRAAAAGEVVGAFGGDGLVGSLAGALHDTGGTLAVLPCGRGNDFARVLGIPRDPAQAAQVAVEGEERLIDIALANGVPYVGIASFGFDSDANRIANDARIVRGSLVYLYAALRALAGWRTAGFEISVDGESRSFSGFSVAVANSKAYGGGMFVVPHAELDDGRLDVFVSTGNSKLKFLRGLPKVFKGTHVDEPETVFLRGREISVAADRPFTVYADGDPIGDLPMTMTVEQRALRVIAPADSDIGATG